MSIETDTKVQKLEARMQEKDAQMAEMQFQMSQVLAAINAMVEVNSNAVLEGDEVAPKARNGKVKK